MSAGGNARLDDELRTTRQGPGPFEKELQSRFFRADAEHFGGIALTMPPWAVIGRSLARARCMDCRKPSLETILPCTGLDWLLASSRSR